MYDCLNACVWTQAIISVCTSWLSIGMGLKGIVLLKDLFPYQAKQTKKVKVLKAQISGLLLEQGDKRLRQDDAQCISGEACASVVQVSTESYDLE